MFRVSNMSQILKGLALSLVVVAGLAYGQTASAPSNSR